MCASIPGDLVVAPPVPHLPTNEALLLEIFYTNGFPKARKSNMVKKLERGIKYVIQKKLSLDLDIYFVHSFGKVFLRVERKKSAAGKYYSYETLLKADVFIMEIAKDFIFF